MDSERTEYQNVEITFMATEMLDESIFIKHMSFSS